MVSFLLHRAIVLLIICCAAYIFLYYYTIIADTSVKKFSTNRDTNNVWWSSRFPEEVIAQMSPLGKHLFLNQDVTNLQKRKNIYRIHMWKYYIGTEKKYITSWRRNKRKNNVTIRTNPFDGCSVRNCEILMNDTELHSADIILFPLHKVERSDIDDMLNLPRKEDQIFVFLTDESPIYARIFTPSLNGFFNWSMTFRSDSDIPVPYGRVVQLQEGELYSSGNKNFHGDKTDAVAIMGTNCGGRSLRYEYLEELMNYIKIDVWGPCGKRYNMSFLCPGHHMKDCPGINSYRFYLAFENSLCAEYITEKLWWNAYEKFAVPVVLGGLKGDYASMVPPNSYINIEDFATPKDLAEYLLFLNENPDEYNKFHEWRKQYKVLNEHGFFGAPVHHYCRICEAINFNSNKKKTYNNLDQFWSEKRDCRYDVVNNRIKQTKANAVYYW